MKKIKSIYCSIISLVLFCMLISQALIAQEIPGKIIVSGIITDENNNPLSNATVKVAGENTSTITKENGTYTITVKKGATLLFTYVGYAEQDVKVQSIKEINIQFSQSSNSLNAVTVIGYGTQKKKNITGAIGGIGSKEIKQVAVVSLDQALQGRVAGVQVAENSAEPGSDVSIRIRGAASITSGSEPLVVVDGVPMSVGLNAINPNDIETIDVLKDAASAAIYGSRGSAGVILVTTKRGKSGKVRVNLDAYTASQFVTKRLSLLNGPQFARLANENLIAGGQDPNPVWQNPENVVSTNWQDEIFRNAPMSNYNISITGGGEKSKNFLSFGYINQGGVLSNVANYKRFTARFNSDYEISSRFKIGVNVNYNTDQKFGIRTQDDNTGTILSIIQAQPTNPFKTDIEGRFGDHFYGFEGYAFSRLQNVYYAGIGNNPVYVTNNHFFNEASGNQLLANAFGELEIVKGLKFKSLIGYTIDNGLGNSGNGKVPTVVSAGGGGLNDKTAIQTSFTQSKQWNWINTLTYSNSFDNHNITAVVGSDALKYSGQFLSVLGTGAALNQNAITTSPTLGIRPSGNFYIPSSLVSYFARVTYNYDSRYLLSATIRRDGSSKFGPLSRWGNFPSVSVGWRISQESFMKNSKVIDELKLRGSYGSVGNQNIRDLQYLTQYGNIGGNYAYTLNGVLVQGLRPTVLGSDDIQWEVNVERNIGVDAVLLKGKISLSVDMYRKELKKLLGEVPIPYFAAPFEGKIIKNSFSMVNQGVELTLGVNQKVGNVNLSLNANFSTLKNTVTGLTPGEDKSYVFQDLSSITEMKATTRSLVGEKIANFWGFVTDGIIQNETEAIKARAMGLLNAQPGDRKYIDVNGDGKITDDDRKIIGNGIPGFLYGFNIRAEYKGFDVNLFFNGQGDVQIANMTRYFTSSLNFRNPGLVNGSTDLLNSWKGEGTSNTFPRNAYNSVNSNKWFNDAYIENGSFIRLRNIQIGYTLSSKLLSKVGASSIRFYAAGQNLLTFSNYSGYDPEVGSSRATGGSGVLSSGVDYGRYPKSKMVTFGFSAQF